MPNGRTFNTPETMIILVMVSVKTLTEQQKRFNWDRPDKCPKCLSEKIWGHGFVTFSPSEAQGVLYLKRYRCQACHCVMTLKPAGFYRHHRSTIAFIFHQLKSYFCRAVPLNQLFRQRINHWVRKFCLKVKMDSILNSESNFWKILQNFYDKSIPFF